MNNLKNQSKSSITAITNKNLGVNTTLNSSLETRRPLLVAKNYP